MGQDNNFWTFFWGSYHDTLCGGSGDDTMEGGYGKDVFVFGDNDGHDVITDFNEYEDRLLLKGVGSVDDISVSRMGGSTFIFYGDTRIELEGVELSKEHVWKLVDSE